MGESKSEDGRCSSSETGEGQSARKRSNSLPELASANPVDSPPHTTNQTGDVVSSQNAAIGKSQSSPVVYSQNNFPVKSSSMDGGAPASSRARLYSSPVKGTVPLSHAPSMSGSSYPQGYQAVFSQERGYGNGRGAPKGIQSGYQCSPTYAHYNTYGPQYPQTYNTYSTPAPYLTNSAYQSASLYGRSGSIPPPYPGNGTSSRIASQYPSTVSYMPYSAPPFAGKSAPNFDMTGTYPPTEEAYSSGSYNQQAQTLSSPHSEHALHSPNIEPLPVSPLATTSIQSSTSSSSSSSLPSQPSTMAAISSSSTLPLPPKMVKLQGGGAPVPPMDASSNSSETNQESSEMDGLQSSFQEDKVDGPALEESSGGSSERVPQLSSPPPPLPSSSDRSCSEDSTQPTQVYTKR